MRRALLGIQEAVKQDRVGLVAAGVAFYALLALFPALAAGVTVFGLVGDPRALETRLGELRFVPPSVRDVLATHLTRLAEQPGSSLGLALVVSVLFALWSAGRGARAVVQALNIAHGVQEDRGRVRLALLTLAMTLGAVVVGLAGLFAVAAVPVLLEALSGSGALRNLSAIGTWVVLAACAAGALTLVYRFAPARRAAGGGG